MSAMKLIAVLPLTVTIVTALAGCGSSTPAAPETIVVTETQVVASAEPETPSAPPATESGKLTIGEPFEADEFTITLQDWVPGVELYGGLSFAALAKIEACAKPNAPDVFVFGYGRYLAATAAGERFEPRGVTDDTYKPSFPDGYDAAGEAAPGECVVGWVAFDIGKGVEITEVRYASEQGDRAAWQVA